MILSSKPNLKTCCIGAPDKISEQILIDIKNKLPETNGVVTLRGELEINTSPFENKLAAFPYRLTNVEPVANDSDTCSILLLSIICLCIVLCATKFRTFFTSFFRF